MRFVSLITLCFLPFFASAELLSCEHKQSLCEAECKVTNINDEAGNKSCNASCLGERVSCSLSAGSQSAKEWAHKAIEAGKLAGDEAKAFIDGFNKK